MKITELLTKETMKLDLQATSKTSVIDELVNVLASADKLSDKEQYKQAVLAREAQSTTGIGEGIAIPHAKTAAVKSPAIAFGRSIQGIDYEAFDGTDSHLFFMIAASEGANNTHLEALSRLSSMLMNAEVRNALLAAKTKDEVISIINQHDEDDEEHHENVEATNKGLVLAVTACPTGIAHTYMAADSLKEKAKELDIPFKVETNGSTGAKNILTPEEIEQATAIIVAADKQVEMERFKGKHVIEVPVADGIRRPKELLEQALKQDAPIFKGSGEKASSNDGKEVKQRNGFYKHLMNGVSNMLPLVVGGGILIAISFMFGIHSFEPKDPSYNRFSEALHFIGGSNAFTLMVPILAGFIAMSIADRPGLAPGLVGGFMASQQGAGFLGGLIAGFLAGYVTNLVKKLFVKLPQSLEGIKPVFLYPLFSIFITGVIMFFVIDKPVMMFMNYLTHFLNELGTGNLMLLGIILGGMMAIDMGGPFNKAAFTFGIAMIDAGNYAPHAAVMAGGMVPPLGIALATTIFRKKFTKKERDTGLSCYVLGACFITEGAIPFAASDPARVLPASIIGSAVAGALTMMFHIQLRAPHGGIFVIPFVGGNPLLYALAIIIGAVVTAVLLGILKKKVVE
ncbi:PTS fructose transporter subunit IIABC [Heyndrickxia ginsengihumi]|uniref:PTS fructose transporter subunit IIA n=1 Tax=Heyndrickxia ginsengihumi TaxID=363870 RepID=A0A0A6VH95_9BACI|nr:PTS fructose transporter subunit IIABC [Heyndrickxia ginsengihumi]KHD86004.1 PTS fructose transporter subunit IIA [Heyndrickxia ginsengihumi]MBE6182947.1 PTS fructose transporter subunit IIABC [Bacillus sp. (in: firmicutes)]MCM3022830.1 fructose-specific PTS transporter subunit EIIC [Heyndrickxia ginsengihumi]NEY20097.1 PTS transporter subunit EIIA [Heyndrickxia ginsengihumi]